MPKKTRKEKVRSDERKDKETTFSFSYTAAHSHVHKPSITTHEYQHIKQDIVKTLILGALFIGIEVFLFIYSQQLGW